MFLEVLEGLEKVLDEGQLQRLNELRAHFGGPPASGEVTQPRHVRNVLSAVKRVELTAAQKESVREIERSAIQQYRKIDRRDENAQAKLAIEVRNEIAEQLDEQQKEDLERHLQRIERRARDRRTP